MGQRHILMMVRFENSTILFEPGPAYLRGHNCLHQPSHPIQQAKVPLICSARLLWIQCSVFSEVQMSSSLNHCTDSDCWTKTQAQVQCRSCSIHLSTITWRFWPFAVDMSLTERGDLKSAINIFSYLLRSACWPCLISSQPSVYPYFSYPLHACVVLRLIHYQQVVLNRRLLP